VVFGSTSATCGGGAHSLCLSTVRAVSSLGVNRRSMENYSEALARGIVPRPAPLSPKAWFSAQRPPPAATGHLPVPGQPDFWPSPALASPRARMLLSQAWMCQSTARQDHHLRSRCAKMTASSAYAPIRALSADPRERVLRHAHPCRPPRAVHRRAAPVCAGEEPRYSGALRRFSEAPRNGRCRAARLAPGPPTVYECALAGALAIIIGSMTRCSCIP
jgi:hypothetical protein